MTEFAKMTFLGITVGDLFQRLCLLFIVLLITVTVSHYVRKVLSYFLERSNFPNASIFVNLVRFWIDAIGLLAVLDPVFGIKPTAFVAALGVGSLVVSLGMQDSVSNVIGGLGLMMFQVVKPGDYIEVGEYSGTVTDVNWRNTTIIDRLGNKHVIPNSVLNKTTVSRTDDMYCSRCEVDLVVRHDADLDVVTEEIRAAGERALGDRLVEGMPIEVLFVGTTAFGFECVVYLHVISEVTLGASADAFMRELGHASWMSSALPN